jgi:uncharacterized protein
VTVPVDAAPGSRTDGKRPKPRVVLVAVGLVIALGVDWFQPLLQATHFPLRPHTMQQGFRLVVFGEDWVFAALLLAFVVLVERLPLSSMGIRRPRRGDVVWGVAFVIAAYCATAAASLVLSPPHDAGTSFILHQSLATRAVLVPTAAICEEILYRGYIIERIGSLSGSIWWGAAADYVLFVLPHLRFFGFTWLIFEGTGALLMVVLYAWRRNLPACMLLHLLSDAPILLISAAHAHHP